MKFIDEFRDSTYASAIIKDIQKYNLKDITIMEVCGTHTMSIFKHGIRDILPSNIRVLSGPGCPVCVTPQSYIDVAINLSKRNNVIIATFGDMIKVPGKECSLLERKSQGSDIKIVYSSMDAIQIALDNPTKEVVFLSVGFEATTPMAAITVIEAKKKNIKNLFFLTSHRIVPPILETLLKDPELIIDGFLLPGHVSAIIGTKPYEFLNNKYKTSGVVTGFEPLDLLCGIRELLKNIYDKVSCISNQYKRVVNEHCNVYALNYIEKVFERVNSRWRGIGMVPLSGYILNEEFKDFDALHHFGIKYNEYDGGNGCKCGEILKGKITPLKCPLFKKECTPDNPIGSCMVSTEGTCAAYYKYYNLEES